MRRRPSPPRLEDFAREVLGRLLDELADRGLSLLDSDVLLPRPPADRSARRVTRRSEPADPRTVLGVLPGTALEICEAVYRARAKKEHPDVGGDPAAWARVTAALTAVRAEK